MKKFNLILTLLCLLILASCTDDADAVAETTVPASGTIAGGPFVFCVDGTVDNVSGITLDASESTGTNSTWVITDDAGKILGLPPTLEVVNGVDFDEAGPGICFIWYLRYEDDLVGLEVDANTSDFTGTFDLSNSIEVTRNETAAGVLSGGPYEFTVDGKPDFVTEISLDSENAKGTNSTFVITDDELNILGLPPTLDAVKEVDFDKAGAGVCLIWYLRFEDGLEGAEMGENAGDLEGCFSLSNSIQVTRLDAANAGTIVGGPYSFCVDGEADFVTDITLDSTNASGSLSSWVITDDQGLILGLPPTLEAVKGVDFDEAGAGTCLIWYLRYEEGLTGLTAGQNANDLQGNFSLSNSITVDRLQTKAGVLAGGPYRFYIDGEADFVTDITLDSSEALGTNSTFVITDDKLNILGLPPTLDAVKGVDFDEAGAGTCLIWYLRFEDGLEGAEMGKNAADLKGCFDLSNSIEVQRIAGVNAGVLSGGPYNFCVDGEVDNVDGITLDSSNASGSNSTWVITDADGTILGLPPTLEAVKGVDFDEAGAGVCLIWYARYEGEIQGAEMGKNANDITGNFALSNPLKVTRTKPEAGTIVGGPFKFIVDGTADYVSGITLENPNASGANSSWIITDESGKILGLPPTLAAVEGVNLDDAGEGTCFIYYIRYEDGLTGLEVGWTFDEFNGCYDISNSIKVVRKVH
ncbi:hypothetical protein [Maribacter sp. 2210JD10-5]|uniref:hypothetical protein n=1 Tax=Maribacter sp. 2210JD10-5 TaxID=3386272 RepID=UPI0039BD76F7